MDADFSLDMTLKGEPMQIWHMIVAFDEYVTGNASISAGVAHFLVKERGR